MQRCMMSAKIKGHYKNEQAARKDSLLIHLLQNVQQEQFDIKQGASTRLVNPSVKTRSEFQRTFCRLCFK